MASWHTPPPPWVHHNQFNDIWIGLTCSAYPSFCSMHTINWLSICKLKSQQSRYMHEIHMCWAYPYNRGMGGVGQEFWMLNDDWIGKVKLPIEEWRKERSWQFGKGCIKEVCIYEIFFERLQDGFDLAINRKRKAAQAPDAVWVDLKVRRGIEKCLFLPTRSTEGKQGMGPVSRRRTFNV